MAEVKAIARSASQLAGEPEHLLIWNC